MTRHIGILPAILGMFLEGRAPGAACTLSPPHTARQEMAAAKFVFHVTVVRSRPSSGDKRPDGSPDEGSSELIIHGTLKSQPPRVERKVLILPRYIPVNNPKDPPRYIIFCDLHKGELDPFRGILVTSPTAVDYYKGLATLDARDRLQTLRFCFQHLEHADPEVAKDAHQELVGADPRDLRVLARKVPAEKIAQRLSNPRTPANRLGLYALLLGYSGKVAEVAPLRRLVENVRGQSPGEDNILAGYTLLQPQDGWGRIRTLLGDEKKDFMARYTALRALRLLWDEPGEVVSKKTLVEGACLLLDQPDIADLAIEDLRKRKCWQCGDRVLALYARQTHQLPIIRRSIVRYALSCPTPRAVSFVKKAREKDPELVKDTEELLELEKGQARTKAKPTS